MTRLIVVTFLFLGWAFYEMSGGAEFEPASERVAAISTNPLAPADPVEQTPGTEAAVTRVSLNLTPVEDVLSETDGTPRRAALPQQRSSNPLLADPESTENGSTIAIIPSLIPAAEVEPEAGTVDGGTVDAGTVTETAALVETEAEAPTYRQVSGNRVNVRGGPGTNFGIVGRVVRGDDVEILEDNGDGWVRMRAVESGTVGYIADFLLSDG